MPAVYSDGSVTGLLLPALHLTNEIDQSGARIRGTNIRPTSVMILTYNSGSTLLIAQKKITSR